MFTEVKDIEEVFETIHRLGSGLHATVYKARCRETDQFFALKISKKSITKKQKEETQAVFEQEVSILQQLDHKNIVKLVGAYHYQAFHAVCLELLQGKELFDHIADLDALDEVLAKKYSIQILEGLEYIHANSIAHFDLKPENMVFGDESCECIKIIDFSLACRVDKNNPIKKLGGTAEFMSPEAINYDVIETSSDMWSFGVILYMLLTGFSPYLGDNLGETQMNILKNNLSFDSEELESVNPQAIDLLKKLLIINKSQRLTATQCLQHKWITKSLYKAASMSRVDSDLFNKFKARQKWKIGVNKILIVRSMHKQFK